MMDLVRDGALEPSAEMVAERAGVGLRSVFRHFKDMESLRQEMYANVSSELTGLIQKPFGGETWRERLAELIERRAEGFERVMPFRRAGNLQAHRSDFLQANRTRINGFLREVLRGLAPPALVEDEAAFEALDLLLCFESWIRLRHDQGLSPERARQALMRAASAVTNAAEL